MKPKDVLRILEASEEGKQMGLAARAKAYRMAWAVAAVWFAAGLLIGATATIYFGVIL